MLKKYLHIILTACVCFFSHAAFANLPFHQINWPDDDRGHLDNPSVVTEWWFFTGKLTSKNKRHYSYYATVQILRDIGQAPILYYQVTDMDNNKVYGNTIKLTKAGISSQSMKVIANNFELTGTNKKYHLAFTMPTDNKGQISVDLNFAARKPPLLIGPNATERGLITMGNNTNSYYYSLTRLQTGGTLQIDDKKETIDDDLRLTRSWMDHQWGDYSVDSVITNNPWIWIAMQLEDGTDINVGEFVTPGTESPIWPALANISKPDGSGEYLPAQIIFGAHKKGVYPLDCLLIIDHTQRYRLTTPFTGQSKNQVWMGIMSVNGHSLMIPNAPFAILENTVPR